MSYDTPHLSTKTDYSPCHTYTLYSRETLPFQYGPIVSSFCHQFSIGRCTMFKLDMWRGHKNPSMSSPELRFSKEAFQYRSVYHIILFTSRVLGWKARNIALQKGTTSRHLSSSGRQYGLPSHHRGLFSLFSSLNRSIFMGGAEVGYLLVPDQLRWQCCDPSLDKHTLGLGMTSFLRAYTSDGIPVHPSSAFHRADDVANSEKCLGMVAISARPMPRPYGYGTIHPL